MSKEGIKTDMSQPHLDGKKSKSKNKKQHQQQQQQHADEQKAKTEGDAPPQSKAELKAIRRALQDAQRAAKQSKKEAGDPSAKQKSGGDGQGAGKQKHAAGKQKAGGDSHKAGGDSQNVVKPKSATEGSLSSGTQGRQEKRVADSLMMDDERVQKKVAKKLAKQQVPQRSIVQKKVRLFSHLHQYEKDTSLTKDINFSSGAIHPAILKLGLQYAEGIVCGSNARCIGLLCAFRKVISDYTTPPSKELPRDLEGRIKPYISFLNQCRPLSVSMGNAIKYIKLNITQTPPGMPENEAKEGLLNCIERFWRERIVLAGEAISKTYANAKIKNGDVILTYGCSSLIVKILKDAHSAGKKFRVIVVDSRPKLEGRECIRRLVACGIKCSYVLINAVSYIIKEVTSVFLAAHALLANGYVMSRAGSSMVAMVAKANNVPVLVCCETYKFCDRVQTDAFVMNELGDPDDLVHLKRVKKPDILEGWRDSPNLYLLNLVYDVTPPDFVDMVVTEIGMIPCTSVPVVLRVQNPDNNDT